MPAVVLVAYTYEKGSTTGVAQAIAKEQEKAEIHAAVAEMDTVVTFDLYDAVILGTPGYSGKLLGNVASFVRRHGERIDHIPVAVFLTGIAPVHLKAGDPVMFMN